MDLVLVMWTALPGIAQIFWILPSLAIALITPTPQLNSCPHQHLRSSVLEKAPERSVAARFEKTVFGMSISQFSVAGELVEIRRYNFELSQLISSTLLSLPNQEGV